MCGGLVCRRGGHPICNDTKQTIDELPSEQTLIFANMHASDIITPVWQQYGLTNFQFRLINQQGINSISCNPWSMRPACSIMHERVVPKKLCISTNVSPRYVGSKPQFFLPHWHLSIVSQQMFWIWRWRETGEKFNLRRARGKLLCQGHS